MVNNDDVLDVRQAAQYLRTSPQTLRRLARRRQIPGFKVGGQWRFKKSILDRWAESQRALPGDATILVVDDEEPIRDTVRRILEKEGFKVVTAARGAEALEIMRRGVPDAIILDLKMPGMDGPSLLGEIRREWNGVRVIILTGYPDSELMKRALIHSPITLLAKPAPPEQIVEAVRGTLGLGRK